MRWLSRFRRWLDRRRQPVPVYITPEQFRRMKSNQHYWDNRYTGPTTS